MVDIENEVFTRVATDLRSRFSGISVEGVTSYSPSVFPSVYIEEADNYAYLPARDSASNDKQAVVVYEVNVYSNKAGKKKAECKKIIAAVDAVMGGLGFTRLAKVPINTGEAATYRIFARYRACASENKTIYRR